MVREHFGSEAKCPYCDTEYIDTWDWGIGNGCEITETCAECGKEFRIQCDIDVTYTSLPMETDLVACEWCDCMFNESELNERGFCPECVLQRKSVGLSV